MQVDSIPVVGTADKEIVSPVLDHAERLTGLEYRQGEHERTVGQRIDTLRMELTTLVNTSTGEVSARVSDLLDRVTKLEAKLEAGATSLPVVSEVLPSIEREAERLDAEAEGGVSLVTAPVENAVARPESMKRGIRARRKSRRGNK